MVVDEVATVPVLFLIEVRLGHDFVGEEFILGKLEDQAEAGTVEILHADVGKKLQRLFIAVGDSLCQGRVLHRTEPELWNALHVRARCIAGLGWFRHLVLILFFVSFAGLDFFRRGLGLAVHDLRALLV